MTRLLYASIIFIFILSACTGPDNTADDKPTSPGEFLVTQGTQLIKGDLRIGVIRVTPDSAMLAILIGSAPEEKVELKVGEEIVRDNYRIRNLETRVESLARFQPGSSNNYVKLEIKSSGEKDA